jgi:hypothetical protein
MKFFFLTAICASIIFIACSKQDTLEPIPVPEVKTSFISFKQDTIALKLSVTIARKENVGSLYTTAIEGKLPDSILKKNNLIIRVTGDSARTYTSTEIFASYTDSVGVAYATTITDTINKVTITKLEKKKQGAIEGNFTIKVSNSTKTKTLLLKEGKLSTNFLD